MSKTISRASEKEELIKNSILDIIIKSFEEGYSEGLRDLLKDMMLTHSKETFEYVKSTTEGETLKLLQHFEKYYKDMLR